MESEVHAHICHQCGWSYPNRHPSAKKRRAHKKICGKKLHESQEHNEGECEDAVNEERKEGCLVERQVSNKSVEEEYSDAVTEFTDPDLKPSNGASKFGMEEMESIGLGQKLLLNESGGSEKVCFYEDSLQVQEDCARREDIDCIVSCADCDNETGVFDNMLTPVKPVSMPSEGSHVEMAEGCEEKIAVESSTSSTKESGVTVDMEVRDTNSGHAIPDLLSCKVAESDNMPHFEDSHPQVPVCYDEVPIGRGSGNFDAKDVSRGPEAHTLLCDAHDSHCDNHNECSEKLNTSSVEDADKTDQVQFVDAYGSLGSSHNDRKVECSIGDSVIGNGAENTSVDELMLSVVNTVPRVPNSGSTEDGNNIMGSGDVDFQECHSENYVEDSNKYETVSVGTSVSGTEEAGAVSSDCSIAPLKEERNCDDSLEAKVIHNDAESTASAVNTVSYSLYSSSKENSDKFECSIGDSVIGNGAENTTVDELMLSVVNTVPCVPNSGSTEDGNNIMDSGDVDFQECHSENYVEDSNKYETVSVGTSVSGSGTEEAGAVSSDCSIGPLKEERKCDDSLEAKVIHNDAESTASAVNTVSYSLNSSSKENSDKILCLGDENSQDRLCENNSESSKSKEIRNTETSASGTDQVVFVGATDSTRENEYIIEAEMIQNSSEKATSGKLMTSDGIGASFGGTEQVVLSDADDSIKPLLEESRNEHITEAGVMQNGTIEKLIASAGVETFLSGIDHAVFSGADDSIKPLLGEGETEYTTTEAEVAQNGAKNGKSGESIVAAVNSLPCLLNSSAMEDGDKVCSQISEENEKSVLEKQLKSMALVILNHSDSQFDSAEDYDGSVSVSTIPPSTSAMSSSSVAAAETLPGTDSQAPNKETQVPEPVRILSCEAQQLSNTNIPEVSPSKTLDESSKAKEEHCVSEIQAFQNSQQAHASTLKAALDEVLQGRKKNEEIAEKMTSRSVRAPLKSFLAEPNYDHRQEATTPGHSILPTYEDGVSSNAQAKTVPAKTDPELSTSNGSKKYTDNEWDSPARLPKNEQKKRVRWPPFLCCLHVPNDGANLVGAD